MIFYDIEYQIKNLNREKTLKNILNICSVKGVKISNDTFSFSVPFKYYKKVEEYFNKKEITILNKTPKGIFAFLKSTIFRLGIILAVILFCAFLCVSNSFVFTYEILGNELIKDDEILAILENQNVKGVVKKSDINTSLLENELLLLDKVSLVSVIVKGNALIINIKEKVYNLEYEDKGEFLPLKSNYNAVITEINVIQGTPLVKVGQTVKVGQDLISPYVKDTSGQTLSVKPMADIKADVFLTTITQIPNTYIEMVDTGKIIANKQIMLFGVSIFSKTEENHFKFYRIEEYTTDMSNNLILPVKIYNQTIYEQQENLIENYFLNNKEQILNDCQQKTRQLVGSCEIIKEEYSAVTTLADINQVTYTVVVNKSIC